MYEDGRAGLLQAGRDEGAGGLELPVVGRLVEGQGEVLVGMALEVGAVEGVVEVVG